jgi:hypothetical protein
MLLGTSLYYCITTYTPSHNRYTRIPLDWKVKKSLGKKPTVVDEKNDDEEKKQQSSSQLSRSSSLSPLVSNLFFFIESFPSPFVRVLVNDINCMCSVVVVGEQNSIIPPQFVYSVNQEGPDGFNLLALAGGDIVAVPFHIPVKAGVGGWWV